MDLTDLSISSILPANMHTTITPITPTQFIFPQPQVVDPAPLVEVEPSIAAGRQDKGWEIQDQIHYPVDPISSKHNTKKNNPDQHLITCINTNVAITIDDLIFPASVPSVGDGEQPVDLTEGAAPPSHCENASVLDQETWAPEMMTRQQKVKITDMTTLNC